MHYQAENECLKIAVNDTDAELSSLYAKEAACELLWQGDPMVWTGQSPILFPIVGRLWQDRYEYQGKSYFLKKHGFALNSRFALKKAEESELLFSLKDSDETKKMYPFSFELEICFRLVYNTVQVRYIVYNTDVKEICFAIGGHPGFRCQMGDKLVFNKPEKLVSARMDDESYLKQEQLEMPDLGQITVTPDLFFGDALIFHQLESDSVVLEKQGEEPNIRVGFGQANYLGIWAKPGAKYVCIEPWTGADDHRNREGELSQKPDIISLKQGENHTFAFDITVLEK